MADTSQQQPQPTSGTDTNPVLALFSNFLKIFNLPLPPPFSPPANKTQQLPVDEEKNSSSTLSDSAKLNPVADEVAVQNQKPSTVRYPHPATQEESLPSLKIEGDEVQERDSNPATLWQVYALGGFLVLSWAWRRWNERRGSKKSPEEDPPAPE